MVSTFQEKLDGDFLLQAQAEAGVVHVFPELLTKFSLLSSRRNGGFTLLELLVVVALIASDPCLFCNARQYLDVIYRWEFEYA